MKILVCVSKVPDTTTKINFSPDKTSVDYTGVQFIINPYDEHGLAKALELKEKHGGEVTVITVDDNSAEAVIRKCLAIGADKAIRVDAKPMDGLQVAQLIADAVKDRGFDLIITGRESIDYNSSMVCDALGELLGVASVSYTKSIETEGNEVNISRFIDDGTESISASFPVVISATKELAEPRIPNMRGIMQARTKPIETVSAAQVDVTSETVSYVPPKPKSAVRLLEPENAAELIEILHNEAKII